MTEGRDLWYHDEMAAADITADCPPVPVDAEHPLFILYTSGSTGTPKGVLHTTGGYLLYAHDTAKYVFNLHDDDIHFCTADIGWITGHSYIVYGPLSNGVTSILYEGLPTYAGARPLLAGRREAQGHHDLHRADRHPHRSRARTTSGSTKHDMPTLRVLGSVGEPIDAESLALVLREGRQGPHPAVRHVVADRDRRPHDHPAAGRHAPQAGLGRPPVLRRRRPSSSRTTATPAGVGEDGHLCITAPWPGMIRGTWGDEDGKRFKEVYFSMFKGYYITGDGCAIDADGDHWLKGRIDDVLNVSGHRIGTSDVEGALVSHPAVAEAAVVGYPHDIKGTGIYTYVTLIDGVEPSDELRRSSPCTCARSSAPSPRPTRCSSPRRVCPRPARARSCAASCARSPRASSTSSGDTSTLADPAVVEDLKQGAL